MRHVTTGICLTILALAAACSDDGTGPDASECTGDTGSVDVTVSIGSSLTFDWDPPCAVALLIVEEDGSDQWLIASDDDQWDNPSYDANRFLPPLTYGVAPSGVVDSSGPDPLVPGITYDLVLWRVLPEGSAAVCQAQFDGACLLAVEEFVR